MDYFEQGCKPPDIWGIGTEHEKFLYRAADMKRLGYDTEPGILGILKHMRKNRWQAVWESGKLIGLSRRGASISLEPGGQFELSGRNFRTVHDTFRETLGHFEELKKICSHFGVFSLPLGFDPVGRKEEMPWMPKRRYALMRTYMPLKGAFGLDMMTRTATIQVNLDYGSESDMVRKMRVAQGLQPVVTALFANSPFSEGKPNGYLSYRARVWEDTDPERCGFLPFVFEPDFGFERWTDYLLDVPMYFILRDGRYLPAGNMSFREFMKGKHALKPILGDWETHVSTVFPDVRLKRFLEMRGADGSCVHHIAALAALWVGLLYDEESLAQALELVRGWTVEDLLNVRARVPRAGLQTRAGNINLLETARRVIRLADDGLTRRAGELGIESEGCYLEPLCIIAETGQTQAEKLLQDYKERWKGDLFGLLRSRPGPADPCPFRESNNC